MMEYAGQMIDLSPVNLRRRRFLMVSVAMLAILGIAMGVSFLATTGTTTTTVSGGQTNWVFPVADGNSIPAAVDILKYTTANMASDGSGDDYTAAPVTPTWTPVADSAGSITESGDGDMAIVDATVNDVLVTLYITNLADLQQAYSSWAFKIKVWQCTSAVGAADDDDTANGAGCDAAGDWTVATDVMPSEGYSMLTNTDGFLQWNMDTAGYYLITMEAGGAYFCFDTSNTDNLGPDFFFSAKASA